VQGATSIRAEAPPRRRLRLAGRRPAAGALAALTLVALLILLIAVPGVELFHTSLEPPFPSFGSYSHVFDGSQPYRTVVFDTFLVAAMATAVTAAIGLPFAYYAALRTGWKRTLALTVLLIPFFTGILVKNFAWTVILQDNGVLNDVLRFLHLGEAHLLFTRTGVLIGMSHYLLPLFVLPVFSSLVKIDPRLVAAARSLGAGPLAAFRLVTLPLARPGIVTGTLVTFIVSLGFYRGFRPAETLGVIADGMRSAATIMIIVATALAFGHWMTESGVPAKLVQFTLDNHFKTWEFLLAINFLLLVLGCFLEVAATLLLVLPILAPALHPLGVDPVHFSIIFTHNMEIALVHPPVGLNLYVLATISDAPVMEVIRGVFPFILLLLLVLGIITYVPILTLWLPNLVYGG